LIILHILFAAISRGGLIKTKFIDLVNKRPVFNFNIFFEQ